MSPIPGGKKGGAGHRVGGDAADDPTQATRVRPPAIHDFQGVGTNTEGRQTPPRRKTRRSRRSTRSSTEFRKNVTLGKWPQVKEYIASLPDEEAMAAYRQLLKSLQQRPGRPDARPAPAGRARWRRR